MRRANVYVDLDGNDICLGHLDAEEQKLLARIRRRARTHPDWCGFDNYWLPLVAELYDARGVSRTVSRESVVYRVAQDLSNRLGIAGGFIRPDDYRDELEDLIRDHFKSRQAFCKATGLSAQLVDAVLAGREDLSLATLTQALEHIGYELRIAPARRRQRTG